MASLLAALLAVSFAAPAFAHDARLPTPAGRLRGQKRRWSQRLPRHTICPPACGVAALACARGDGAVAARARRKRNSARPAFSRWLVATSIYAPDEFQPMSEDCLFLNICVADARNAPVLVWDPRWLARFGLADGV